MGTELRNISEGTAASLPGVSTLRRNIRKAREDFDTPPNPTTREEIPELPKQCQLTVNGQQFMMFDSGIGDHERMFIFASEFGVHCLAESNQNTGMQMVPSKSALSYSSSCTPFIDNNEEAFFPAFLNCCRIIRRQHTQGFSDRYSAKLMS